MRIHLTGPPADTRTAAAPAPGGVHLSDACIGVLGVRRARSCEECVETDCEHGCHTPTAGMTFERIISRNSDLIAAIIDTTPGAAIPTSADTAERFADLVSEAADRLWQSPDWADDADEIDAAHRYLRDALATDDPAARSVLLARADEHLNMLDVDDWLD